MALFDRRSPIEKALDALAELSEEDKAEVLARSTVKETEDGEQKQEPPQDGTPESPAPSGEAPQTEESAEDEQPQEPPETDGKGDEVDEAQQARLDAMEENIAKLSERVEQIVASMDGGKSFGKSPTPPSAHNDGDEDSRIMRDYYGSNQRAYTK